MSEADGEVRFPVYIDDPYQVAIPDPQSSISLSYMVWHASQAGVDDIANFQAASTTYQHCQLSQVEPGSQSAVALGTPWYFAVGILDDRLPEWDETFEVLVNIHVNARIENGEIVEVQYPQSTFAVTGTIVEDDPIPVIEIGDAVVIEGSGFAEIPVSLSFNGDSTVVTDLEYHIGGSLESGSATAGEDFFRASPRYYIYDSGGNFFFWDTSEVLSSSHPLKTIQVPVLNDSVGESSESFTFTVPSSVFVFGPGVVNGSPGRAILARNTVTVTIQDNDTQNVDPDTIDPSTPPSTNPPPSGTSGGSSTSGGTGSSSPPSGGSGSTTSGSGSSGSTTPPASDPGTNTPGSAPSVSGPTVSITSGFGSESAMGVSLMISVQNPGSDDIVVNYSTNDGSATSPSDYSGGSGTITIPAGTLSDVINIPISDDSEVEGDETFTVSISLGSGGNATLGTSSATTTITDNDGGGNNGGGSYVGVSSATVSEKDGFILVGVFANPPSPTPILVTMSSQDITATNGSDYSGFINATVTIPANATGAEINFQITQDTEVEDNETFNVVLSNPIGASFNGNDTATVTITDDEPTLSVTAGTGGEGTANGNKIRFTISRNFGSDFVYTGTATADYTITFEPSDTATAADLGPTLTGSITIDVGSSQAFVDVTVIDDYLIEGNETFTFTLSNSTGASIGEGVATGSIYDNEPSVSIADATARASAH